MKSASLALIASLAATSAARGDALSAAWMRDGQVETRSTSPAGVPRSVPLGSLWKLWVYAYAVERGLETPTYRCAAPARAGEEYCCDPGGAVDRDQALARSCGLFFAPTRLGVDAAAWRTFWEARVTPGAAWVADLARLQPDTRLAVPEILSALAAIPAAARETASTALLPVMIDGYGKGTIADLGGALRVKTYTWKHPQKASASMGGGAGWLVDGTPVWFGGTGASRQVLHDAATHLREWLPSPREAVVDDPCVVVDYFERYPFRAIDHLPSREAAEAGPLHGSFRVLFENGNALTFSSRGELRLDKDASGLHIRGRLSLSDYVARVVDREADGRPEEAARALAVVARTWVLQNAAFTAGCYHVADSTRMQRVSPNRPSSAAREASLFTHGLILAGQAVRYEREGRAAGVLGWTAAVEQARDGRRFDAILASAFPSASLSAASGEQECRHLPDAQQWLARMIPQWRRRLERQPGFDPPAQPLTLCGLDYGNPYADRTRFAIHVRGLSSVEDRVAIAHEYVHLAFRYHPNGGDEAFVERTARSLAE